MFCYHYNNILKCAKLNKHKKKIQRKTYTLFCAIYKKHFCSLPYIDIFVFILRIKTENWSWRTFLNVKGECSHASKHKKKQQQLKYIVISSIVRMSTKRLWSPKEEVMDSVQDVGVRVGSRKASERRYNLNYALRISTFYWAEKKEIIFQSERQHEQRPRGTKEHDTLIKVLEFFGVRTIRFLEVGWGKKLQEKSLKEKSKLWIFSLKGWSLLCK